MEHLRQQLESLADRVDELSKTTERRAAPAWPAIGIAITVVLQGVSGVWWAATLSAEVKGFAKEMQALQASVSATAATRYSTADAVRDQTRMAADVAQLRNVIEQQDLRVREIERQLWRGSKR